MFNLKGLIVAGLLALTASLCLPAIARAQGCGPQNPNCIVPTAPVGTSNNQAASTAFVQNQIGHGIPYTDITGLPANTILGSVAGGAASALTPTQVTTFCNVFTASLIGCVPAPVTIAGKFLRDDGSWQTVTNFGPQSANFFFAGPTSGSAANPAFRAMVDADLPAPFTNGTATGNTTKFATGSGTFTNGDCAKFDASGNIVDNGAQCGAGANTAATQNFVAGAGFTPGSTTSLTLSSSPTNAQQLLIAFDGMVQSHNTWSLAGAVVTFNQAIPANVSVVEAQWYTASTTAGVGSLTDPSSNVASGAVNVASPLAISANTLTTGGACFAQSRAAAILLPWSSCNVIMTGGYANPGDGGGAIFTKAGSSPFIDSQVTGKTFTGGSACTNGTYFGVIPTGGTGRGLVAVVTVSGNVVSAIDFTYSPGNAYTVGDTLTIPNSTTGCASNTTMTVTSVSTPLGSFTDSSSTKWQIVNQFAVNSAQFGTKGDFNGTEIGNTDNFSALKAAMYFANYKAVVNQDAGGAWGGRVIVPNGGYWVCGSGTESLEIPEGVLFEAASHKGATIEGCAAWDGSTNFVELCDPNWHFACFGSMPKEIQFRLPMAAPWVSASGSSLIHSNNDQDFGGIYNVYMYGGIRPCLVYEKGYGGASTFTIYHPSCTTASAGQQIRIGSTNASLNVGTTAIRIEGAALGGPSSGGTYQSASGIIWLGGFVDVIDGHAEEMPGGVEANNTGSITAGQLYVRNFNAGSGAPAPTCLGTLILDGTNTPGNTRASSIPAGSCTDVIDNGQSGGISTTTTIVKEVTCVSGACS